MPEADTVTIIAEAGVNHNGSLQRACEMVDVAAEMGATVIKFQTFVPEKLVSEQAAMAEYQQRNTGEQQTQLQMLRGLALDEQAHRELIERCASRGVGFLSAPFDLESLAFLVDGLGVDTLKIASGELTNAPLLVAAGRSQLPVILSTGMSTLDDIRQALGALAWGALHDEPRAGETADFAGLTADTAAAAYLREKVVLLHCTTQYPTPPAAVNLKAIKAMQDAFGLRVGFSDHTTSTVIPAASVAMGACVIEKHFTLDRHLPGPDHAASLEPDDFRLMVAQIRAVESALGDGEKQVQAIEKENLPVARKSLVAAEPIARGAQFDETNLTVKRPGGGISPFHYWRLLGTAATRDYAADEPIDDAPTVEKPIDES